MATISEHLGGSKATLYDHFSAKENLLLAVVENVVAPNPSDYDLSTMPTEFRDWLTWFGQATTKRITSCLRSKR